ncbi:MAG: MATE family efflux transporter [Methanobrevibacter sp.]|uniref:MATE family efflux transporter n=1 Tax=Methanobrevibacter millerae TaxID=230361 RepID=A0A8T3VD54_9EURY|nr:MATE family efflux transporter [Methanobrevibacter millerae]MBE6504345.1 MATE family efflux transporter [Methanobrevibacter millerae]MBR0058391.1 MATE family efflux transporter [Methanobrevibacter sp.]MBR0370446.1 MATE family efflux transporter [Methanobrevibacter sp.]
MEKNSNIEMITGDPKKAINKLSLPIIASMFLIFANNIIDSIWVAGLGAEPLAALGYITPLFMIIVGFGNGIGAGGNSLISRFIGAEDKTSANNAAIHNLILSVIVSIVISVIFLVFLEPLLVMMGASSVLGYAMDYGFIVFACTIALLMPPIVGGAFRAEGDIKRATLPIALAAIINMILDPIFIYTLNMGIAGAAWATALGPFISLLLMFYWIFVKKDTFLSYNLKDFTNDFGMYKDILVVGIPASLEQLVLSVLTIFVNYMLTIVSGPVAVAVYTAGWRIINIGMLPAIGVGTAAISVAGVAFGAKKYENLRVTARYAVKVALIASIIVCIILNVFSNQIALIFSYSESSAQLAPLIAGFLQIMCLFILYVPFGASAGNVFQGVGKGTISFVLTTFREFILVLIFAYILGFVFNMGEFGIYCGMLLGGGIGSLICYTCIELYINKLIKERGAHGI